MKNVYVGRWDLLPEKWDGIRGLTEMFPDAIIREVGRQMKVVGNKDPQLNNLQRFNIGDNLTVVEISLEVPAIIVRLFGDDGPESYITSD